MGWLHIHMPEHEGYIVGLVKDVESHPGWFNWREVTYSASAGQRELDVKRATDENGIKIRMVQVACECGWRSPRIPAPFGTTWKPYSVDTPPVFEEICRAMFYEHIEQEKPHEKGFCEHGRHAVRDRCPDAFGNPCVRR